MLSFPSSRRPLLNKTKHWSLTCDQTEWDHRALYILYCHSASAAPGLQSESDHSENPHHHKTWQKSLIWGDTDQQSQGSTCSNASEDCAPAGWRIHALICDRPIRSIPQLSSRPSDPNESCRITVNVMKFWLTRTARHVFCKARTLCSGLPDRPCKEAGFLREGSIFLFKRKMLVIPQNIEHNTHEWGLCWSWHQSCSPPHPAIESTLQRRGTCRVNFLVFLCHSHYICILL